MRSKSRAIGVSLCLVVLAATLPEALVGAAHAKGLKIQSTGIKSGKIGTTVIEQKTFRIGKSYTLYDAGEFPIKCCIVSLTQTANITKSSKPSDKASQVFYVVIHYTVFNTGSRAILTPPPDVRVLYGSKSAGFGTVEQDSHLMGKIKTSSNLVRSSESYSDEIPKIQPGKLLQMFVAYECEKALVYDNPQLFMGFEKTKNGDKKMLVIPMPIEISNGATSR